MSRLPAWPRHFQDLRLAIQRTSNVKLAPRAPVAAVPLCT
jgi:hypothetical protein